MPNTINVLTETKKKCLSLLKNVNEKFICVCCFFQILENQWLLFVTKHKRIKRTYTQHNAIWWMNDVCVMCVVDVFSLYWFHPIEMTLLRYTFNNTCVYFIFHFEMCPNPYKKTVEKGHVLDEVPLNKCCRKKKKKKKKTANILWRNFSSCWSPLLI